MRESLLSELQEARHEKRPVVWVTELGTGDQWLLFPSEVEGPPGLPAECVERAREALAKDRPEVFPLEGRDFFLNVYPLPLRLLLVGAVHIAQPLAEMAALAGFSVTVIDPRTAFASKERFPSVELSHDWPDEAIAARSPDARTAIVTLTHDPKFDDAALAAALRSDAFYIGSLGSRKTHASRVKRLREEGFAERDTARIHGPLGLPLGGRAPAEIAVSALAQILQCLRAA